MPSPADLVLRDAVLSDIQPIAQLVAGGPDAAADWTYPDWRSKAAEMERLYVRVFGSLLAARRNLVRVAERGGRVVGYCAWVKREKEGDEVVTADLTEGWDEKELDAEVARLIGTDPVPKFASVLTGVPARLAAIKSLRDGQAPEPCLAVASYQLLILGVSEDQQGLGIGGRLIREGMERAAAEGLPVFVTGEGRGMRIYLRYGFQSLKDTWFGWDREARSVGRGTEGWEEEMGGLEASQMVWVPEGRSVEVKGEMYHG